MIWKHVVTDPLHKSHNALDKYTCAHFCYKMVRCGIWDSCIVRFQGMRSREGCMQKLLQWIHYGCDCTSHCHGGTTEEGNCSYLLPLSHRDCAPYRATHTSGRSFALLWIVWIYCQFLLGLCEWFINFIGNTVCEATKHVSVTDGYVFFNFSQRTGTNVYLISITCIAVLHLLFWSKRDRLSTPYVSLTYWSNQV